MSQSWWSSPSQVRRGHVVTSGSTPSLVDKGWENRTMTLKVLMKELQAISPCKESQQL